MIIDVTVNRTKKKMYLNKDKIIQFYEIAENDKTVTVIEYEAGDDCWTLHIVEDAKWLQQRLNVKDPWF